MKCSIKGCKGKYHARGYCQWHYKKFRADGSLPLLGEKQYTSDNLRPANLSEGLKRNILAWLNALPAPKKRRAA